MITPEKLHEATDRALYGLTADESLKQKILQKAAACEASGRKISGRSILPAFCVVMAALVLVLTAVNSLRPVDPASTVEIKVFSAGSSDETDSADSSYPDIFDDLDSNNVISIELSDVGKITDAESCAALISLLKNNAVTAECSFEGSEHSLIIESADGTKLCFNVTEPFIGTEKSWSCESFFESLHNMIEK